MREAPKRILIVEDMEQWQGMITRVLQQYFPDATFVAAQSWDEVVAARHAGEPDLITMDGSLTDGGYEGPRFVQQLRADGVACPIIMISGDSRSISNGMQAGANSGCDKSDVVDGGMMQALQKLEFVA